MKKQLLLLYLIVQLGFYRGIAQNKQLHFEHIGASLGLSQSNIQSILQDTKGFMWFGTWEGLNKYDGYKITVYKNNPANPASISNNYINNMCEASGGDLWIATDGGGLCRFNRADESFTRFQHKTNELNGVSSDVINFVLQDRHGILWIGTPEGLDKFEVTKNKFTHFKSNVEDTNSLADNFIKYIFEDSEDKLWIGTAAGGLNLFDRATTRVTRFLRNKKDSNSISGNDIYSIFEDVAKRFWIGTNGSGMDLLNRQTGVFTHFRHQENNANSIASNTVLAINEDAENNLWVSSENKGLSILNHSTGKFSFYKNDEVDKESISNNSIYVIYKDTKKNMWLGNFAGEVDLLNRDKMLFDHYKHNMQSNSLSNNQVLSIMEDRKKNIWIGTDGGGLNLFDPSTETFTHFKHQNNNSQSICGDNVLSTFEDSDDNLWIGTWSTGMTVYNPRKNTYRHFKNNPEDSTSLGANNAWKIFQDKQRTIWVGTYGSGLDMLNKDGKTFTHFAHTGNRKNEISNNFVVDIFEDSDGQLWLCTAGGGLNLFNSQTKTFTVFKHDELKNSISNNYVNAIFEDRQKKLWISTMLGLNMLNKKTGQFTVFREADGMPGDYVYGMLEDEKNHIWITTNKGLADFDPQTKLFKNYKVNDGLQANDFKQLAFCKSANGKMYFGGINGFNTFFPASIKTMAFTPPLVLTNIQIFNQYLQVSINDGAPAVLKSGAAEIKRIELPYNVSAFSFEFATLNYTEPGGKKYWYMLEGFDSDWNEAGTARTATYTNLSPKRYVFKVKGLNNEGKWSSDELSITVIITPPYWQTWWFRVFMILAAAGAVASIYLIRTRAVRKQHIRLRQLVQQQTEQLLASTKEEQTARRQAELANKELTIKNKELEQFAYVASHDLQEPLRTTYGFAELLQRQYKGRLDEKADKYLEYITTASERMKVLIKDLLDFSRIGTNRELDTVDCNVIVKSVLADISLAITESKATIMCGKLPEIHAHTTEIKLLFQNLIINAIKFHKDNVPPMVEIRAEKKGDFWQFCVCDNGIGIEELYGERIFKIFQRLHTRTEYPGSGIGLSHCKKIVEMHHGKIWVQSVPGEGSQFYFLLPVV